MLVAMEFWRNMPESPPDDRTLFVGNLSDEVTEEILWELFLQAGPLKKIVIPRSDQGQAKRFAFVELAHEISVPYALDLMNGIRLFGKPLRCDYKSNSCHKTGKKPTIEQYLLGEQLPDVFKGLRDKEKERTMQRTISCPSGSSYQHPQAGATAAMYQQQQPGGIQIPYQQMPLLGQYPMQGIMPQFGNALFTTPPANSGQQFIDYLRQGLAVNQQQYGNAYQNRHNYQNTYYR